MGNNSSPTLQTIYKQALGDYADYKAFLWKHRGGFVHFIQAAIEDGLLDKNMSRKHFKLEKLSYSLEPDRDSLLTVHDVEILAGRLLKDNPGRITETPQYFWMRLAMTQSRQDRNPTRAALELYEQFSLNPKDTLSATK